jgi:uncharacterized repeat protein (TIGR03803 family)
MRPFPLLGRSLSVRGSHRRNPAGRWGLCRRLRLELLEDRRLLSLAPTTLASFWEYGVGPQAGVIMDSAGNLFGTTAGGGTSGVGTVFEIAKGSGTITTLASFNGANGGRPYGGVIEDASGTLFGTASQGGASNAGTVFELAKGSGTITTLASFNGSNGELPYAGVIEDASGTLFGTTDAGGASNAGTVFELAKGSGTITTLASFNRTNGANPYGGVIEDASGNLFGTTSDGGASNDGTVFEVADGSGTITTLAAFNGSNGESPHGGVIEDASGNLFGTTAYGGTPNDGTVFEVAAGSGTVTTLASFNGSNGQSPCGGVVEDAGGNLFGTTQIGGAWDSGAAFEVAGGSGTITTLASFGDSGLPQGGVIEDASGNLFGTTEGGGASGYGTVFELAKGSGTITTLASFNPVNAIQPRAGVIEDASGNLFGTTAYGGTPNDGTVFEDAAGSGTITKLASFNGTNGEWPYGGVAEDAGGNLFGTTESGGASGDGTVLEIANGSGTITTLASFNGSNGDGPFGGVIEDANGNLFGTTEYGGASGDGTVFEVGYGSGMITTLASFNGTDGASPQAGLIEGASGNLFGTATQGGASGDGTVFEVASGSSTITTLASFNGTNGEDPRAGVIEDASGNLFGTTDSGGASNYGTAFEVAKGSGTITTLASFNHTNGASPHAGLIEDAKGNLFGTTYSGGTSGYGTVFEIAKGSHTITTLASFNGANGESPYGGVIEDASGNLLGTTEYGGAADEGTVFELPYADDGPLTGTSTASATGGVAGTTAATLSAATFSDANTAPPAGNFSIASVAWGDGSTNASGLSITGTGGSFTVSGSHLYANAGSYNFTITLGDAAGWTTTITGTAVVSPAPATVTLGSLTQTYSGSPEYATVTTGPAGLATSVVYTQNGQPVANPTAAGSYQVVATITNPNYAGSATGTLVINPAVLTVNSTLTLASLEAPDMEVTVGSGGWLTVTCPLLLDSGGSVSVVGGGVLTVPGIDSASTAIGLDLDGGTLQASSPFSTSTPITVGAGGAIIDTAGNSLTLGGAIGGVGDVTVIGAGSVTPCGANTYPGGTTVSEGVLAAESTAAIPGGSLLTIGAEGSVVLGALGAAEPVGAVSGGGAVGSTSIVTGSGSPLEPAVVSAGTEPARQTSAIATTTPAASSSIAAVYKGHAHFSAVTPGAGVPSGTVTLMIMVAAASGTFDNGGTVTLREGSKVWGTGSLTGGVATSQVAGLTAATHIITVSYGGDAEFLGSSTTVTRVVNPAPQPHVAPASADLPSGNGASSLATPLAPRLYDVALLALLGPDA